MKLKFFILFLFIGIATHLRAQTAVLASHAVSYASEIPCVSHYINIKCSPLQSINVQIIYFRNNDNWDTVSKPIYFEFNTWFQMNINIIRNTRSRTKFNIAC